MLFRLFLLLIAIIYILMGGLMMFDIQFFSTIYDFSSLNSLHHYLASRNGALFIALGLGALFAIWRPSSQRGIITMLLIAAFFLFIGDVVALARGYLPFGIVLPELIFFVINWIVLLKGFPDEEKKKKHDKPDPSEILRKPLQETQVEPEVKPEEPTLIADSDESASNETSEA